MGAVQESHSDLDAVTPWRPGSLPNVVSVPRIDPPELSRFKSEIRRRQQPVVFRGAASSWPALQKWDRAFLEQHYGDRKTRCYVLSDARVVQDPEAGILKKDMSVGEFLQAPPSQFRLRSVLHKEFPELIEDIEVPVYCRDELDLTANFWVTPAGSITPLHWDMPENLFVHLSGEKRFLLASPADSRNLYSYPTFSSTPQLSMLDMAIPDVEQHPRLKKVQFHECVLQPGDILYLPSRWWHFGQSASLTISVNFWWLTWKTWPLVMGGRVYKRLMGYEY